MGFSSDLGCQHQALRQDFVVGEAGIIVSSSRHHVVVGDWFFEAAEVATATAKHTEQADADDHTRNNRKDPHWW